MTDDPTAGLADRLTELEQKVGGKAKLARLAGLKPTTMQSWFSGADPSLSNFVRVALATGVNLYWLATGQGPRDAPDTFRANLPLTDADYRRVEQAFAAVEEFAEIVTDPPSPSARAEMALALHDLIARRAEKGEDTAVPADMFRLCREIYRRHQKLACR